MGAAGMTDHPEPVPPKLIYLTCPDEHQAILNIQINTGDYPLQFALSRHQLLRINLQCADLLWRMDEVLE
jgi:hypothetical protein